MMLEILEISLICQNVKKQSIFKKKSICIIFFFSVVILYTVQYIQEEDFPAPQIGGQFEKPLTPVGQQRGMGE
jgi:hypothetical protein